MSRLYLSNPCAFSFLIAHGAAGAVSARLSLRPFLTERDNEIAELGQTMSRECLRLFENSIVKLNCRAGQAKRDPGPITTGLSCLERPEPHRVSARRIRGYGSRRTPGRQRRAHRPAELQAPPGFHPAVTVCLRP